MGRRVGALVLGVALAFALVAGSLRSETETAEGLDALAAARVKVAQRALERIRIRRNAASNFWLNGGPDIERIVAWSQRLMEAEADASETQKDRVAAVRGHIARLAEWQDILHAQREVRPGGGDDSDFVEYYLLEAKERLIEVQGPHK